MAEAEQAIHWADVYAEQVIREKGDKELYVAASGITPSGTVHIGNFREIISVELVVRALRERGKKVRFIYSWDDYDVFRKVPKNMPGQEALAGYLRQPITRVPDPFGKEESYARHNEREIEELLPVVGIFPEYIYQYREYGASRYAEGLRTALEHREELRAILDEHRTEALAGEWWPISIFCTRCHKDATTVKSWDGQYGVSYSCKACKNEESLDLRSTGAVKLLWRVDWPMRWAYQRVDFEPAGKDHHTEGGSFDTGRLIVKQGVRLRGAHQLPVRLHRHQGAHRQDLLLQRRGGFPARRAGDLPARGGALPVRLHPAEHGVRHFLRPGRDQDLRGLRPLRARSTSARSRRPKTAPPRRRGPTSFPR